MSRSRSSASDAVVGNQRRIAAGFLGQLRPWIARDRALPSRLERLLKSDRRLGARDRRLYRELIYTYLRHLPWLETAREARRYLPEKRAEPKLLGRDGGAAGTKVEAAAASAKRSEDGSPLVPSEVEGPLFWELLAWLAAETPATRGFRDTVLAPSPGNWPPCPAAATEKAKTIAEIFPEAAPLPSLLPEWCAAECPVALEPAEYDALNRRAALWLRVHDPKDVPLVLRELKELSFPAALSEVLPGAIRIDGDADVTKTRAYQTGLVEIQDLGSQLILATTAPSAGETWLDACAGAGGKTLQLASLLGPAGRVYIHDIRPAALAELEVRARRAGLAPRIVRPRGGDPRADAPYDGVLVDAPCSGTGTWRRSPHLKWSTMPAAIAEAAERQAELLSSFAPLVRPGGRLIYATCSLCERENAGQIAGFLASQPGCRLELQRLIRPSAADTDGFFVASLRRAK